MIYNGCEHGKLRLGKVDYLRNGRKTCPVVVEFQLYPQDNGKGLTFSASGEIWNHLGTDCYCCGQNLDEIAKFFPHHEAFQALYRTWKEYHLNDLQGGCSHQIGFGWDKEKLEPGKPLQFGNMAMWERPETHRKGLLTKPCPVCGYRYGTAWRHKPMSFEAIRTVQGLLAKYRSL
jgi:hypothetical protein